VPNATFTAPDLTTFTRLDELGLVGLVGLLGAMVAAMQRLRGILALSVVVLLAGCSLLGAKANPAAPASSAAAAQKPPVSSVVFDTYVGQPGIVGDFSAMEGSGSTGDTALGFRAMAQRVPCMADYTDKISLTTQAGYLHDADRTVYLMIFRFPSNEQAAAVQAISADMIQCVSKEGMSMSVSPMGTVKAGGTEYPVYSTLSGDVYRVTVLTVRNVTAAVIVRGEAHTPIDAMASEVYESINRLG